MLGYSKRLAVRVDVGVQMKVWEERESDVVGLSQEDLRFIVYYYYSTIASSSSIWLCKFPRTRVPTVWFASVQLPYSQNHKLETMYSAVLQSTESALPLRPVHTFVGSIFYVTVL